MNRRQGIPRGIAQVVLTVGLSLSLASGARAQIDVRETVQRVPDYATGIAVWAPDGSIWAGAGHRGDLLAHGRVTGDGHVSWRKVPMSKAGVSKWGDVVVGRDGDLYWVGDGYANNRLSGKLVRVDATTGRMRWTRNFDRVGTIQTASSPAAVRVIASMNESAPGALVEYSGAGRRLQSIPIPGLFPYGQDQQPLSRAANGDALVVNFARDAEARRVSRVRRRSSVALALPSGEPWGSIALGAGGVQWLFGDTSASGAVIGVWDGFSSEVHRGTVPLTEAGSTSGPGCGGEFPQPAFRRAVVVAGDGALWARARCWDADEEPYGPSWWVVTRPVSDAPDGPLVTQVAGSEVGRATQVSANVTVGPDAALWSIDYYGSQLLRTEVPGSPAPLAARVVSARRAGSRLLVRLNCVSEVGRVCSGTVRLKRGGRTVRSGRYFVAGQPAGIDSTTTRTFSTRGLPNRGLRASVTGAARSVAVR